MERTARQVGRIVESSIPARLDALPWSRFHTLVIVALGITWILDGLEVTLAGAVSGALKASPSLRLSDAEVGLSASAYLTGAVLGALLFGWLTDRFGRKRLFSSRSGFMSSLLRLRPSPRISRPSRFSAS
jgi:MFS family permease